MSVNRVALTVFRDFERALVAYTHIFEEVESGGPLDPERAKALKASTEALLREVAQVRSSLQKQATLRESSTS
jgi:hypothetical protein